MRRLEHEVLAVCGDGVDVAVPPGGPKTALIAVDANAGVARNLGIEITRHRRKQCQCTADKGHEKAPPSEKLSGAEEISGVGSDVSAADFEVRSGLMGGPITGGTLPAGGLIDLVYSAVYAKHKHSGDTKCNCEEQTCWQRSKQCECTAGKGRRRPRGVLVVYRCCTGGPN